MYLVQEFEINFTHLKLSFQLKLRKTIINSLPTTVKKCNPYIYVTCVKELIAEEVINEHGCSLPILPGFINGTTKMCGRDTTINILSKLFDTTVKKTNYKHCHNVQPCKNVVYSLTNPDKRSLPSHETVAKVQVTFESTMVESIEDSYDYNAISIFSEIGGSVGVLTGVSCMTIVELCLGLHKKLFAMLNKSNRYK